MIHCGRMNEPLKQARLGIGKTQEQVARDLNLASVRQWVRYENENVQPGEATRKDIFLYFSGYYPQLTENELFPVIRGRKG
jgi:transcriptional regulator with XRE-family HTH domain